MCQSVAISEIISYCSSHSPCFCYTDLLAAPSKMPLPQGFCTCYSLLPETVPSESHTVCSLTSFRSLFKYFLIREAFPITQYKRARNDGNQLYNFFPPTYHLGHIFVYCISLLTRMLSSMMDPVNNHMTLELLRPFPGGKIKGQNILVNSGTRQNDS